MRPRRSHAGTALNSPPGISFPGGNTTFARHMVKALIPDSIYGNANFFDVLRNSVNFKALDVKNAPTRIRLGATVIRVEHEGSGVAVTYEHGGKLYRSRGRAVLAASAGWANRHMISDLPDALRAAYDDFIYAPALSVNVALRNWRFLYKLRAPAVRYFDGDFGWSCNIRQPMAAGFKSRFHPDEPIVLTFYTGIYEAGRPAKEQGDEGRKKLLSTTYADYEFAIRKQLRTMFEAVGIRRLGGYRRHRAQSLGTCAGHSASGILLRRERQSLAAADCRARIRESRHRPLRAERPSKRYRRSGAGKRGGEQLAGRG